MTLDGKLLARAKAALSAKKQSWEAELQRRTENVYRRNPKVQTIDADIRTSMLDVIGIMLQKNGRQCET